MLTTRWFFRSNLCMRKLLPLFLLLISLKATSQIEILTVASKKPDSKYIVGLGAMLKFGFPASDADEVSLEIGCKYIPEIEYPDAYGIVYIPLKVGYRYTLDRSGTGWFTEPQLGYSIAGARSYQNQDGMDVDEKVKGPVAGLSFGYLFEPGKRGTQYELSLRYESVFYNSTTFQTVGLRLSHNISFRRRD